MRKILLSVAAAAAIVSAASLAPTSAQAMTPGAAAGVLGALEETSLVDDVRYVCRHRGYSSRRVCWWEPGRRHYRPWRGHRRWR
jgi:hypothetical protein